jgi:hypothetical protein
MADRSLLLKNMQLSTRPATKIAIKEEFIERIIGFIFIMVITFVIVVIIFISIFIILLISLSNISISYMLIEAMACRLAF